MDVFKIDQSLSGNLGSAPSPDKINPEVSFDAGQEFNLCFFDNPEDSSTQGFSDPGSVGSTTASSPPPQPQQLTPLHIPLAGSSTPVQNPVLLSPPGGTSSISIKQGIYRDNISWRFFLSKNMYQEFSISNKSSLYFRHFYERICFLKSTLFWYLTFFNQLKFFIFLSKARMSKSNRSDKEI